MTIRPSRLLARVGSGTLTLHDTPTALEIRAQLPATSLGRETATLARRGDLNAMSFAFTVVRDACFDDKGEPLRRVILEVGTLIDVSAVTFAAYPSTSCAMESGDSRALRHRRRQMEMLAEAHPDLALRDPAWCLRQARARFPDLARDHRYRGVRCRPPAELADYVARHPRRVGDRLAVA